MGEVVDLTALRTAPRRSQGGDGDGPSGGLETEVAILKVDVAHLKGDVAELRADVRNIKTDVGDIKTDIAVLKATMASKSFVVAVVVGTGAVIGAITTLAPFLPRLLGVPH